MSTYRKITVAVDLSDQSTKVIKRAQEQLPADSELHIVHVVVPVTGDYSFQTSMSDYDDFQQAHRVAVEKQLSQLLNDIGLSLPEDRIHLLAGNPAKELRQLCSDLDADLLVIGSHGYGTLLSVLGSTTSSVLHGIGCDVLTVRI
jgi:universal stress protein A